MKQLDLVNFTSTTLDKTTPPDFFNTARRTEDFRDHDGGATSQKSDTLASCDTSKRNQTWFGSVHGQNLRVRIERTTTFPCSADTVVQVLVSWMTANRYMCIYFTGLYSSHHSNVHYMYLVFKHFTCTVFIFIIWVDSSERKF